MKQTGKNWIDGKGKEVPTYAINPVLKGEEKWAQKIMDAALKAEQALKKVVELSRERKQSERIDNSAHQVMRRGIFKLILLS